MDFKEIFRQYGRMHTADQASDRVQRLATDVAAHIQSADPTVNQGLSAFCGDCNELVVQLTAAPDMAELWGQWEADDKDAGPKLRGLAIDLVTEWWTENTESPTLATVASTWVEWAFAGSSPEAVKARGMILGLVGDHLEDVFEEMKPVLMGEEVNASDADSEASDSEPLGGELVAFPGSVAS